MSFDTLNNEIIKKIEKDYSKSVFKAMKVFKIILTGYNSSQQKNLHVFEENGWKFDTKRIFGDIEYFNAINKLTSKINIIVPMKKRKEDNTLDFDYNFIVSKTIRVHINIDKSNELFGLLKQIEKIIQFQFYERFGNESIIYTARYNDDGWYNLYVWFSGVSSW